MTPLSLVFAGSPSAAVPSLRTLAAGPHAVQSVITRPPAPVGRRRVLTPTPVAQAALELGIPVRESARPEEIERELVAETVDLGVIVAYGALLREPVLSWPRLGWINLHFSLLPRWRGAAPVQHALIAGDQETGATVFQLTQGMDDGDWYAQHREAVREDATAGELLTRLSDSGAALLASVVDSLARGDARARPQQGDVTFAPKLGRDDGRLDWEKGASAVLARWRGVTPEPGAWTQTDNGLVVKLHELAGAGDTAPLHPGQLHLSGDRVLVGTAQGAIELARVQPAGKQAMRAADWARGWGASAPRFS